MTHDEVARIVVDTAVHIHKKLGRGLLESVYTQILAYELQRRGLRVRREVSVPIRWDGVLLGTDLRIDLLVEDLVVVEVKAVEQTIPVHKKQVLTYLRLADKRLGILVNFGAAYMKDGLFRIVNGLDEAGSVDET